MNYKSFLDISLAVLPSPWPRLLQPLASVGFVLCFFLIVLVSFAPASAGDLEQSTGLDDKVAHFLAYAAVMGCGMWAVGTAESRLRVFLALVLFSAVIELGQPLFAEGREGSLADMLANTLGLIFGVGLGVWLLAGLRWVLGVQDGR